MKFEIKNLGPIKEAEIELGDLTIICGKNNTGKTRIAYAIYDFFKLFREYLNFKVDEKNIEIDKDGNKKFSLVKIRHEIADALKSSAKNFSTERLNGGDLELEFDEEEFDLSSKAGSWRFRNSPFRVKQKGAVCTVGKIELDSASNAADSTGTEIKPSVDEFIKAFIDTIFFRYRFQKNLLPNPFAITTERTGLSVFRKVINIGNSRIVQHLAGDIAKPDADLFLMPMTYPLAIQHNLEYFNRLEDENKRTSFLANDKKIIAYLDEIVSGKYEIATDDYLTFTPKGTKTKLLLGDSSSSVRALLLLDFYIRHTAMEGDLLLIDEPELNLHPENQRKLARLLVMLVNSGIKIFITTHSDNIIRELNTLFMLGNAKKSVQERILKKYNIFENQILKSKKIYAYNTTMDGVSAPAEFDPEVGVTIDDMDESLRNLSRIQRDILRGE